MTIFIGVDRSIYFWRVHLFLKLYYHVAMVDVHQKVKALGNVWVETQFRLQEQRVGYITDSFGHYSIAGK